MFYRRFFSRCTLNVYVTVTFSLVAFVVFAQAAGDYTCESCVHRRDNKTLKASCFLAFAVSKDANCLMALLVEQNGVVFFFC